MFKRIIVGTDGSRTASRAVDHAIGIAQTSGADVIVVAAYQDHIGSEHSAAELGMRALDEVREHYKDPGVKLRTRVKKGAPADAICDVAEEESADLIVVGSVGIAKGGRFSLGGVPDAVAHHAPCNVIIVHTSNE
jgi:nucleotide-binding universal stress UspA family protein